MSIALVPLAFLMWAVTTLGAPCLCWRRIERLPPWAVTYLRLAGPAALAALAAVNCLLTSDKPPAADRIEPVAVGVCVLVVARTRLLLPGVAAAVLVGRG